MTIFSAAARVVAGIALGIFFYGGLWLTVRQVTEARPAAWLTLASFWLRSLVVVAGFLLLIDRRWEYALLCLGGFTAGRLAVAKLLPGGRSAG